MNAHMNLFWVAAALLLLAGVLLLAIPGNSADPLKRRNRRTGGVLFLAAGAVFAALAGGLLDRLL
ncbi:hypothetical protein M8312_11660 [Sphingomonas sp. KRR8]|uniref:hypothetical protein n=1 Tax=Sphingomonas sp. KRR8 TaxID=2942996 RepID=UPI002020A99F|nr:hypothetical protein [Sphingomonas sp. KRR8]URD60432.1 hypothetical protein M8312_11660 [Sphingomonas sp. KRR8]